MNPLVINQLITMDTFDLPFELSGFFLAFFLPDQGVTTRAGNHRRSNFTLTLCPRYRASGLAGSIHFLFAECSLPFHSSSVSQETVTLSLIDMAQIYVVHLEGNSIKFRANLLCFYKTEYLESRQRTGPEMLSYFTLLIRMSPCVNSQDFAFRSDTLKNDESKTVWKYKSEQDGEGNKKSIKTIGRSHQQTK